VSINPSEDTMKLDDLSAEDLAAIDSVCLEFEKCFGGDRPMSPEAAVDLFISRQKGSPRREHLELLRQELVAIESELALKRRSESRERALVPTPFRSKTGSRDTGAPFSVNADSAVHAEPVRPIEAAGDADAVSTATHWSVPRGAKPSSTVRPAERSLDQGAAQGDREFSSPSIGPYSIGRVLARGGMGVVYRAVDTRLDRPVAIKMMGFPNLSPSDAKRIELVERFEREAKAVAALSHPNIVELFDVGVEGDVPYAVMEFLSGLTLAEQVSEGPMSAEETCQIGMQIAGALSTAHAAGVIHRDLKPQNVMLVENTESGKEFGPRVKLLDFGLSRVGDSAFSGNQNDESGEGASQTRSGMILGTPGYMAPEQARGESATSAADMFGFGCVLYETFYGRPAIPGETPVDRLAATLRGEVQYDPAGCEKARVLCTLIAECLQKEPTRRPSAADVFGRLRQFDFNAKRSGLDGNQPCGEAVQRRSDPEGWLRRHALTTLAGGLVGGLLGGWTIGNSGGGIGSIRSLAVLTLRDAKAPPSERDGLPLADRKITDGETLASAIANELSSVEGLAVVPYRPETAESPDQFRRLGQELDVDAFLTGSFENKTLPDLGKVWVLHWQLVSAIDGSLLHGEEFVTEQTGADKGDQFLVRSAVASNVAKRIGRVLVVSRKRNGTPDPMAYGCIMKGHAYADADSVKGLRQALLCFGKAHQEDPTWSEPLAAIAVASLNLAARSDPAESLAHLEKARSSITQALELDPQSVDARLAQAMLEWQSLLHYEEAYRLFEKLLKEYKYNWQVQHQRGLLLATLGSGNEAVDALRTASKLNPMSMMIKTDRCRVDWFFGYDSRAVRDATRYRETTPRENPARKLPIGLLIDVFEERGDYRQAAAQLGWETAPTDAEDYFRLREPSLRDAPYGPFGAALNRAIFDLRRGTDLGEGFLGALNESGATMFPLVLARHPAFASLRKTPAAAEYLPLMVGRFQNA
jgi:serine/threonine protein kinase